MQAFVRLIAIVLCSAPAWAVPLASKMSLWETDDGSPHLFRALAYHLAQGVPWDLPRWTPDFFLGFGYPVFNYYSPLTYLAASMLSWVGLPLIEAYTLLGAGAVVVGATGAASAVDRLWPVGDDGANRRSAAMVLAGASYALAPYPFLVNLHVRGDLPEAWGLAILPWFLVATHRARIATDDRRASGIGVASSLGITLVLVHALSAVMAAGCAVIWTLVAVAQNPIRARSGMTTLAIAGAVVAGATAFSTFPMLLERDLVHVEVIKFPSSSMVQSLAAPFGLGDPLVAPERSPYGATLSAVDWSFVVRYPWGPPGWDGPVKLGAVQAGVLVGALVTIAWNRTRVRVLDGPLVATMAIAATCWLLNVNWSAPVWAHVDAMRWLQFPSRLWGPFSLAVAILSGRALLLFDSGSTRPWMAPTIVVAGVIVLASSALPRLPVPIRESAVVPATPSALVEAEYARNTWAGRVTSSGEFTPRSADFAMRVTQEEERAGLIGRPAGNHVLDWTYPPASWIGGSVLTYRGIAAFIAIRGSGVSLEAEVDVAPGGATIAFHQIAFPGWRATIDGNPAAITIPPYREDEDALLGIQLVDVPPGRHTVAIGLGATTVRLVADAISTLTLGIVATVAVARARKRALRLGMDPTPTPTSARWATAWLVAAAVSAWLLTSELWSTLHPAPSDRTNRLVLDVAAAVQGGTASLDSPSGGRLGADAFLNVDWLQVGASDVAGASVDQAAHGGRLRRWLFMHPPSRVKVAFDAPTSNAYFQSGLALRPDAWTTDYGDGVTFVVDVGMPGAEQPVASCRLRLNPRALSDERRWVDVRVPLDVVAGRRATVTLRTEPVADVRNDWAGWGNPMVVVDHAIRRPANGPRPPASVARFGATGCELS